LIPSQPHPDKAVKNPAKITKVVALTNTELKMPRRATIESALGQSPQLNDSCNSSMPKPSGDFQFTAFTAMSIYS